MRMPQWLCNQMMRAFQLKDRKQIKLLNDCWYFYRTKQGPKEHDNPSVIQ